VVALQRCVRAAARRLQEISSHFGCLVVVSCCDRCTGRNKKARCLVGRSGLVVMERRVVRRAPPWHKSGRDRRGCRRARCPERRRGSRACPSVIGVAIECRSSSRSFLVVRLQCPARAKRARPRSFLAGGTEGKGRG